MDALVGLLDGPRAHRAFLLRSLLEPAWSLRIQDEAPLTLVALVRGGAWIVPDHGGAVPLHPGDVADDPATAPQVVIHPGQRCATPDGDDLHQAMDLGVRTWGNDPRGSTLLLTGTYQLHGEISRRLLDALPTLVVVPAGASHRPLVSLLDAEMARHEPGQESVLDRMLDVLLIAVLRAWFNRPEADAPAWYVAHGDPVVGPALRMLFNNPAHPWTVARLAAEAGISRAALARRFTALVGEPPMRFLTEWRLALAADLLRQPGAGRRRPPGRLRQPLRPQHGVQAGSRLEPQGAPRPLPLSAARLLVAGRWRLRRARVLGAAGQRLECLDRELRLRQVVGPRRRRVARPPGPRRHRAVEL